jgi:hypothetical protein
MAKMTRPVREAPPLESDAEGPAEWLVPFLEARYTRLAPKPRLSPSALEQSERELELREEKAIQRRREEREERERRHSRRSGGRQRVYEPAKNREMPVEFESALQPGWGREILAELSPTYWFDLIRQYRQRQAEERRRRRALDLGPAAPGIPGTSNWVPIGPSVVRRGQAGGRPAISGRASGIAIAPGGSRVYVAAADGGVWRSDDAGATWTFTMEGFDIDPTAFATTSLACGAIAIDPADPDRVYVGTGEGDTNALFGSRLTFALPSYRGVGALRSDDGGLTWINEPTAVSSPPLVGGAFFALAVDPGDRENVVAATTAGIYRREPDGVGGYHWVQKRSGVHSAVVVARTGTTTTFFSAAWGDTVYQSNDGDTWTAVGTGFPTGTTRIGLAVRRTDPGVLYAMIANTGNSLLGVYRLDGAAGPWRAVSGAPATVLGSQGDYDLTIAVDPNDVNTIYLGGQAMGGGGAIYRGQVTSSGSAYAVATTFIGANAHADVHVLLHAPGDSATLWACCDGGVFKTTAATGTATFQSCNVGLGTLSANYFAQHPTQSAVVFCGLQDNGTARYTGEECWTHVQGGDGGYPIVNWNDPFRVLVYANGRVYRATDGGRDYGSWTNVSPPVSWFIMAEPLVSAPYNPANPAEADIVAFGAGTSVFLSTDFGGTWATLPAISGGLIYAMVFASASRLYVGTTGGRVYRYDQSGATWTQTRLDNAAAGPLPLTGLLADLGVDPADASGQSVYAVFGGSGDYRHVWHFDGTAWQARSGPAAGAVTSLLDVEHNAIIVDPDNTATVYVAADVGVWRSLDAGANWSVLENGLPDAAVLDLQIHRPARLLRASLHGRGVFEYKLDSPVPADVELYIRDTMLDMGRAASADGLADPSQWPIAPAYHYESPNIKIDVPTPSGYQTPSNQIDFYQFNDTIVDGSQGVGTMDPALGTVTNRVYVEVHNRGIKLAPNVQVMLLLTNASAGLPGLPGGYTSNVQTGTPITTAQWQTVGIKTVPVLKVGIPQVVEFNLPSTMLPPPASLPGQSHFCLVALLHSSDDPYTSTQTSVDALTVVDRKVGQKNLQLVQFVGTPPPPANRLETWAQIRFNGLQERDLRADVVLDLRRFPGRVGLVLPKGLFSERLAREHHLANPKIVAQWAARHRYRLQEFMAQGRFDYKACARMIRDIEAVAEQPMILCNGRDQVHRLEDLELQKGVSYTAFLHIQLAEDVQPGAHYEFGVMQVGAGGEQLLGGSTFRVEVMPPEVTRRSRGGHEAQRKRMRASGRAAAQR